MFKRIHKVAKMQDMVKRFAVVNKTPVEAVVVGDTVEYRINGTVVAYEAKLTATMLAVHWTKRFKSDYVFVNEALFQQYAQDVDWLRMHKDARHNVWRGVQMSFM